MADHASKLETSLVNYLLGIVSANPPAPAWPATLATSRGVLRIFAGENNVDKDGQRIVCAAEEFGQEDPPCSGNRWAFLNVELRTPFSIPSSGVDKAQPAHDAAATILESAILAMIPDYHLSTTPNGNNAVAGLTVFGTRGDRQPTRSQEENYWSSGYRFEILSCPSVIPA